MNAASLFLCLVADGCSCPVELRDVDGERLVVGPGSVVQHADRDCLAQQKRLQGRAPEMNPGVDAVAS